MKSLDSASPFITRVDVPVVILSYMWCVSLFGDSWLWPGLLGVERSLGDFPVPSPRLALGFTNVSENVYKEIE